MLVFSTLWEKEWISIPASLTADQLETATVRLVPTPAERSRLITQFQDIETLAAKHAMIMGFFYKQYYISLAMMGTATAVAVISLFFISQLGWQRVNNAVINIFIVATGVVVIYGNISLVFQQRDNIEASQTIYINYLALRNEMLSYWATGMTINDEEMTPAQFIHYMDRHLKAISLIRLGFNPNSISNLSNQLNDLTNSSRPALTAPDATP